LLSSILHEGNGALIDFTVHGGKGMSCASPCTSGKWLRARRLT